MTLEPLLGAERPIPSHAVAAIAAVVIGAIQLARRKGGVIHRLTGYLWVGLIVYTAGTSFFIHGIYMWGKWSAIHLMSAGILVSLVLSIIWARNGNIRFHMISMWSMYVFGLIIAGIFTFAPGRIMLEVITG